MFKLSSQIEFFDSPSASKAKWVSNSVCSVDINSSIQSLTDTCTITIPKKIVCCIQYFKDTNCKQFTTTKNEYELPLIVSHIEWK